MKVECSRSLPNREVALAGAIHLARSLEAHQELAKVKWGLEGMAMVRERWEHNKDANAQQRWKQTRRYQRTGLETRGIAPAADKR